MTCPAQNFFCVGDDIPLQTSGGVGVPEWLTKGVPVGGLATFTPAIGPATNLMVTKPGTYEVCAQWIEDLPDVGDCAGEPILLNGVCPSGSPPTTVQWSAPAPNPGAPTIFSPNQLDTWIIAPNPGTYNFEMLCCHYDDLGANPGTNIEPPAGKAGLPPPQGNLNQYGNSFMSCPLSVIAGDTAKMYLFGCEAQNVTWTITGASGGAVTNLNGCAIAATALSDTGVVSVQADCVDPITGATTTFNCDIPIIPFVAGTGVAYETQELELVVNDCGQACVSAVKTITVLDCAAQECIESYITIRANPVCV